MKDVLLFSDKECLLPELAGGKGSSLAALFQSGYNVPNGFVISSRFYLETITNCGIKEKIYDTIKSCNDSDEDAIEQASKSIFSLFESQEIEMKIDMIVSRFLENEMRYAVRSSATVEDSLTNAWAGQLQSFLNVNPKQVSHYIKQCWCSLFLPRALHYRKINNISSEIAISVVIQEMVDSDFFVFCFSVNPVNSHDEVVLEGVCGLGEAVVSGSVTPCTYYISKKTLSITHFSDSNQKQALYCNSNGTSWKEVDENIASLDDCDALAIAALVINIEQDYGYPVDVEWAIKNKKYYILQARPITTLNDDNKILDQIFEQSDWDFYVSRKFNWYIENTQIKASGKSLQMKTLGFDVALQNYLILNGDEYGSISETERTNKIFESLFLNNINFFKKFAQFEYELVSEIRNYINYLGTLSLDKLTDGELLDLLQQFDDIYCRSFVPAFTRPDSYLETAFIRELIELGFSEETIGEIFSKVSTCPNNCKLAYSSEPLDLLIIAEKLIDGLDVNNDIDQHINTYSWLKAPTSPFIDNFCEQDYRDRINYIINDNISPTEKIANILRSREKNDSEYASIINKYELSQRALKLAEAIREFIFLRTYTTEYSDKLFYVAKCKIFQFISKKSGLEVSQITMLSIDDICEIIKNGCACKAETKAKINDLIDGFYIIWLNGKVFTGAGKQAEFLQENVACIYKAKSNNSSTLSGMSAYYGVVRGTVKVLKTYDDVKKVEKGDIIVASMTTPDYVAAMEKASGYITDEGGITCHAAIISREFKIPCIVGTGNATEILKDGDYVELNALTGDVKLLK